MRREAKVAVHGRENVGDSGLIMFVVKDLLRLKARRVT